MYLRHYGLTRKPFDISPDPSFLWLGEKHQEALAILKYGILENKGFLLITGDVGTGKTALIRAIEKGVQANAIIATIPDPNMELIDFYNFLASELKMGRTFANKSEFLIHFKRLLVGAFSSNTRVLLIVDESQRLNHSLMEEIRLLSNIDLEGQVLINIFFVGQSEFKQVLAKDENRSLRQRITVSYHIQPLAETEVPLYIRHRLGVAGTQNPIFSAEATQAVFAYTRGYPRLINIVCDQALMTGYARDATTIGREIIEECAGELRTTIGLKAPAPEPSPAPVAAPAPQPLTLPPVQATSGPRPLRGLLALAGCMAIVGAAWLIWGDAISDTVADWGHRPLPGKTIDSASPPGGPVSTAAGPPAVRPQAPVLKPAEPAALPKTGAAPQTTPKTVRESRRPAGASAAPGKTQSGASSSPAHSLEPAAPAAAAAEGSSPVAVLPAAPDPNEFLVFFTVKSAEIPIYAQETLTGVARRLAESPRSAAVIEGHTDAVGDPAFNQAISESRAAVVKEFLIEKGIASARLSALGMGSAKPLETNDTPQGRIRNRRVVVRLTDER